MICLGIVLSSSTKKGYESLIAPAPALSPSRELLASYVWKESSVVAYKLKNNDTLTYAITNQYDGTDKDDLSLFRENGTFLFEEGKTKFTPQSSQKYYTGLWQVREDQKELILKTAQSMDTYQIIQLDSSQMVLKLFVKNEENTYYYLLTYTPVSKSAFGQQREWLSKNSIYTEVDQQPRYPGGLTALKRFISKRQQYPEEARKNRIEGKVVVRFVIDPNGIPGEFKVIESLGYGCDEAVLQTCKAMHYWQPGIVDGKPVPVQVTLPVLFKL